MSLEEHPSCALDLSEGSATPPSTKNDKPPDHEIPHTHSIGNLNVWTEKLSVMVANKRPWTHQKLNVDKTLYLDFIVIFIVGWVQDAPVEVSEIELL